MVCSVLWLPGRLRRGSEGAALAANGYGAEFAVTPRWIKEDEWKADLIACLEEYLCLIYVLILVLGFLCDSKMSH